MTRKTMFRTGLATAGALAATLLVGSAAQAAMGDEERRNPGMQRMHQMMQDRGGMHGGGMHGGGMHMGAGAR